MTAPITGPFKSTLSVPDPDWPFSRYIKRRDQTWYRQHLPYDLRLPYVSLYARTWVIKQCPSPGSVTINADYILALMVEADGSMVNEAKSKAWNWFVSACTTENLGLAEDLWERKQAYGMMTNRLLQLIRFAKALNRGRLYDAWRELGLPQKKYAAYHRKAYSKGTIASQLESPRNPATHVLIAPPKGEKYSRVRSIADLWLELHFGWDPLARDIYGAVELMCANPKPLLAKGRGKATRTTKYKAGSYSENYTKVMECRVQYLADVSVTSTNAALLAQAGLNNPLVLAKDITPYSFVADWFSNLSQVLEGYSRLWGLALDNASTTVKIVCNYQTTWNNYGWSSAGIGYQLTRANGLKLPGFYLKPLVGFSVVRGATAASLLVQLLPKR